MKSYINNRITPFVYSRLAINRYKFAIFKIKYAYLYKKMSVSLHRFSKKAINC